jgi:hypothetical protein
MNARGWGRNGPGHRFLGCSSFEHHSPWLELEREGSCQFRAVQEKEGDQVSRVSKWIVVRKRQNDVQVRREEHLMKLVS